MANDNEQPRDITANRSTDKLAQQYAQESLCEISRKSNRPRPITVDPHHIGAARVTAAVVSNVVVKIGPADDDRRLDVSQQIPDEQADGACPELQGE